MQRNLDGSGNQQYFDSAAGGSHNQGYPVPEFGLSQQNSQVHSAYGGSAGSFSAHNSTSVSVMSTLAGGAPSLTFTPSGSTGSGVPAFRNVKKTMKTLSDNYESSVGVR